METGFVSAIRFYHLVNVKYYGIGTTVQVVDTTGNAIQSTVGRGDVTQIVQWQLLHYFHQYVVVQIEK